MSAKERDEVVRSPLVLAAAGLILVAGLIHLLLGPVHWAHAPAHGLFFAASGAAEFVWAVAFWRRPSIRLAQIGTVLAGSLIVLWIITRFVPAPFGHEPETIGLADVACKLAEGLAVAALVGLIIRLTPPATPRGILRHSVIAWLILAVAAGFLSYELARAAEPVFPSLAASDHGHAHGTIAGDAHDHDHQHVESAPEHEHQHEAGESESNGLAPPAGAPSGADGGAAPPPGEAALPASAPATPPDASLSAGQGTVVPPEFPEPVVLQGSGESSSETFRLSAGLAEFRFAHPTDTPFAIFLLNQEGDHLALLANSTVAVTGTQIFGVQEPGDYFLHVIADDGWTAEVRQLPAQALEARSGVFTSLQGQAPAVSDPFTLEEGSVLVRWSHLGSLTFEVVLWRSDGERTLNIVQSSGATEGEKSITVPARGVYLLNVTADGPWTVAFGSP